MNTDAVIARIRAQIVKAGTMRAWALKHDLTPSYVHQVLMRRTPPGPAILAALGMRKEVDYKMDRADG